MVKMNGMRQKEVEEEEEDGTDDDDQPQKLCITHNR